jgi:hypothetical protein
LLGGLLLGGLLLGGLLLGDIFTVVHNTKRKDIYFFI